MSLNPSESDKRMKRKPVYETTPDVLLSRGWILRWMQDHGWPEWVIDSVMLQDNPDINTVYLMAVYHGAEDSLKIVISMLED